MHPPDTPLGRFGIATIVDSPEPFVGSMPVAGLVNPLTGAPTIGPLAVLVDFVAGLVNHYRRAADEWTVSSELSLELTPDAVTVIAEAPEVPVVGSARPLGPKGVTSLGWCELTHRDVVIGTGMVRSVHIHRPGAVPEQPKRRAESGRPTRLDDIMALRIGDSGDGRPVLFQSQNAILNNSMGIVHGGVAAAGVELAASAAINAGHAVEPLNTASLRVNYLRQFFSGAGSCYQGSAVRVGRRSGVGEAHAIGADGEIALIARVTAYR